MTRFSTQKILGAYIISHTPSFFEITFWLPQLQDCVRAAGICPRQYPKHCGESFGSQFFFSFKVSFSWHVLKNIEVFLMANLWAFMNNDLAKLWHQCFLKGTVKQAGSRHTPWWNHSLVLRQDCNLPSFPLGIPNILLMNPWPSYVSHFLLEYPTHNLHFVTWHVNCGAPVWFMETLFSVELTCEVKLKQYIPLSCSSL